MFVSGAYLLAGIVNNQQRMARMRSARWHKCRARAKTYRHLHDRKTGCPLEAECEVQGLCK